MRKLIFSNHTTSVYHFPLPFPLPHIFKKLCLLVHWCRLTPVDWNWFHVVLLDYFISTCVLNMPYHEDLLLTSSPWTCNNQDQWENKDVPVIQKIQAACLCSSAVPKQHKQNKIKAVRKKVHSGTEISTLNVKRMQQPGSIMRFLDVFFFNTVPRIA